MFSSMKLVSPQISDLFLLCSLQILVAAAAAGTPPARLRPLAHGALIAAASSKTTFAGQRSICNHLYALSDNHLNQMECPWAWCAADQEFDPEAYVLPEVQRKCALAAGDPIAALTPKASLAQCVSLVAHTVALVFNAAAACPVFGARSLRSHYLQPPAQLCFTLSQRSLELASLQLRCRDSTQRVQLLCCSSPLSILAFRLARAANRGESSRGFEHKVMARIMKRCFSVFAWRPWNLSPALSFVAAMLAQAAPEQQEPMLACMLIAPTQSVLAGSIAGIFLESLNIDELNGQIDQP